MPGEFDPLVKCPRCGASTLVDENDHRWCSYIGGDTDAPCSWGLGTGDRGSREADRAAWRKKRGIPDPCPSGHPAACITSSGCGWCDEVARLRTERNDARRAKGIGKGKPKTQKDRARKKRRLDRARVAEAALAESQALLALWSGGRAGAVPPEWRPELYGDPGNSRLTRRAERAIVNVYADGRWDGREWIQLGAPPARPAVRHPGPRPILVACAEAAAWLAEREATDVRP